MTDIRNIDPAKLQKSLRIISLITIGTVIGLFIYFLVFPINIQVQPSTQETQTTLTIDPFSLTLFKEWNITNQGVTSFAIDECNTAERIDNLAWQITLGKC